MSSKLSEFIVPILHNNSKSPAKHIGSGFVIAGLGRHAIICTASHVLEEAIQRSKSIKFHPSFPFIQQITETFRAPDEHDIQILFGEGKDTSKGCVFSGYSHKKSDIAVLFVDIDEGFPDINTQLPIFSEEPTVDADIFSTGYFSLYDTTKTFIPAGLEYFFEKIVKLRVFSGKQCHLDKGKVLEILGNGSTLIRSKCFRISTPFNSGMSGGAILTVINGQYVAVGIVSSDESTDIDMSKGTGGYSISPVLAPILDMQLYTEQQPPLTYQYLDENGDIANIKIRTLRDLVNNGKIIDYVSIKNS